MSQYFYGKNVVRQLLEDHAEVRMVWLAVNDRELESLCERNHVKIRRTDKKYMTKLTGSDRHQGVAAEMPDYRTYSLEEMMNSVPKGKNGLIILLDQLEDPHNLGAIIRTANLSGAHGVIIPKNRAVGLTSTVARTSAGALNYTPVVRVTNITKTIEELKKRGMWFVCADMGGDTMYDLNLTGSIGLVIGNEGDGVSRLVKEACDYVASIPMKGDIDSLNASVAAGVLGFEIVRQRMNASKK